MFIEKNRKGFFIKEIPLFISLFLLVLNSSTFSQSIENLDQLDGFKDFKFNASSENFNNFDLSLTSDGDLVTDVYKATNYSADLGPASVENFKLYFVSDKLMKIQMDVIISPFKDEQFHKFLIDNFGEPNVKDDGYYSDPVKFNTLRYQRIWEANKIKLEHYDYASPSYSKNPYRPILIISRSNYDEFHNQALENKNRSTLSDFKSSDNNSKRDVDCKYETVNRADGVKIKVFETLPIVADQNTETALSLTTTQNQNYISVNVRFREEGKKLDGNLSIRLKDNNMLQLPLINGGLSHIGGSNLAQAIFYVSDGEITKLKQSDLKTISYKFDNGVTHTFEVKRNEDLLRNQLQCL